MDGNLRLFWPNRLRKSAEAPWHVGVNYLSDCNTFATLGVGKTTPFAKFLVDCCMDRGSSAAGGTTARVSWKDGSTRQTRLHEVE